MELGILSEKAFNKRSRVLRLIGSSSEMLPERSRCALEEQFARDASRFINGMTSVEEQ